jgi:hypothetical protein
VERTVVEGVVLDERADAAGLPAPLPSGLDDLVPDLDDDLVPAAGGPAPDAGADDEQWADAWVMDEGTATGDAVDELADDGTVTTPAERSSGRWVTAGRPHPGAPG